MIDKIKSQFQQNIKLHQDVIDTIIPEIAKATNLIIEAIKTGHKVILCGNGGSAADAQHIAAELVGRFRRERKALPAIALVTNTSVITAVANDYGYDLSFSRQIEALGEEGDVLIALSTSGNSINVIKAVEIAHSRGLKTIGLLGSDGGRLKKLVEIPIIVPSVETDRVQEIHILIGHIICYLVDLNFS